MVGSDDEVETATGKFGLGDMVETATGKSATCWTVYVWTVGVYFVGCGLVGVGAKGKIVLLNAMSRI